MPARQPTISLKLKGPAEAKGAVDFYEFGDFCEAVAACLKRAESIVTGKTGRIRYRVVELKQKSASVTLQAIKPSKGLDKRSQTLTLFRRTVKNLQSGRRLDPRLGPDDIQQFKRLATPLDRGQSVWIEGTGLTPSYARNADKMLSGPIPVKGSVAGELERLNVHGKNEFVLYPPIAGHAITCEFPEGMIDQIRSAIKRTVTVTGAMEYEKDNPFPRLVRVEAMEIHPLDSELPSLLDLRGSAKGCTGGMTATEYIASIRGE